MSEKILVPIDGSEMFSETHAYLKEITAQKPAECVLLHVSGGTGGHGDARDHPLIKPHYDALAADGIEVSAEIRSGNAVEAISQLAVELPAALTLMSTHGRSGLDNIRQGSVTEQVVRQSPCPVFVLHSTRPDTSQARGDKLFRRMLVPLDGSKVSAAILPCVEQFATMFDAEVILFHDELEASGEPQDAKQRREMIETHGVELANAGVSVKLIYSTHERPIHQILEHTRDMDIDVVAMVTHGDGGYCRPLEESVTANVMRHADRPLLVWSSDPQCLTAP